MALSVVKEAMPMLKIVIPIVVVTVIGLIIYFLYWYQKSGVFELYGTVISSLNTGVKAVSAGAAKAVEAIGNSVPRGAGKPAWTCSSSQEKDGALCYPKCDSIDGVSTKGVGPVCYQSCPSGFRDDGLYCAKPDAYGRGAGRIPDVSCPSGWEQQGLGAAAWCDNGPKWDFWNLKTQLPSITCHADEEMSGGLCYPKCKAGFKAVGCCICSPECPAGLGTDIGVSCTKKTYGRGVGEVLKCGDNEDMDAGLCYPKCTDLDDVKEVLKKEPGARYKGIGPVCWKQ